ncbi:hypothetical protein KSF78_0006732 [Schistosoma japonicum]|nr:hypothetical protein KSF78_0006732 [Schistosoma japonicum]
MYIWFSSRLSASFLEL